MTSYFSTFLSEERCNVVICLVLLGLIIHSAFIYVLIYIQFSSVTQSCPTLFDPMNRSQHARPPCPSPTPGVHPNSRPSGRWCHPAISSSVIPFSSCPQSLPASESFPISQLFAWGGQSTGVSAKHHCFQRTPRADLLQNGLVGSPCSPRDSQESSPTPQFKSINSGWTKSFPNYTWLPLSLLYLSLHFHHVQQEGIRPHRQYVAWKSAQLNTSSIFC